MKIHPQVISQKGTPAFVVLPYKEYENILEALENTEDIEAIKEAEVDMSERFPLDLVEQIASGENAVKVFREYRGLSQAKLASQVGISRKYILQIESDKQTGTPNILKKIATILEVDLDDLT